MELATFLLAAFTAILAFATVYLAIETRWSSKRQIGVTTWLALEARWDSKEMKAARKKLASQLHPYNSAKHGEIGEEVFDLFESMGAVHEIGLLDDGLADSSFSYYASNWWSAAKPYIDQERLKKGGDETLFSKFEKFAQKMSKRYDAVDRKKLDDFLCDEEGL